MPSELDRVLPNDRSCISYAGNISSVRTGIGNGSLLKQRPGSASSACRRSIDLCSPSFYFKISPENALKDSGIALIGLIYIPGLLTYQIALRGAGLEYIFLLYGTVWASDSLALYTGKWLGKHKLYPQISPNKTVEGSLGSFVGGILAVLIRYLIIFTVLFLWLTQ